MPDRMKELVEGVNGLLSEGSIAYYAVWLTVLFAIAAASFLIVRYFLLKFVHAAFRRTRNKWDDLLIEKGVFGPVALLAPAIVLNHGLKFLPAVSGFFHYFLYPLVLLDVAIILDRLLSVAVAIYERYPVAYRYPIRGYVQVVKIFLYIAVGIVIVCFLLGQSPWALLSGLGAVTALLMLIFKDTILSFIASIQIVMNDLVRVGDWIEVPQFNADGDVTEIALYTVKVQNWDKTITTIPTYRLIENSFKNWRGMKIAGGRRIKRAIYIDQRSIRFLEPEDVERLRRIQILKPYIDRKEKELAEYNRVHGVDESVRVNGRRMTNLGCFRAYLEAYLRQHPRIRQDMTFLVRQLAPTPEGLPMEIYVFTNDTVWANYEGIQADIFDHVLACVPEFGLKIYQKPSGSDLELLGLGKGRQDS